MTAPSGLCRLAPLRGGRADWRAAVELDVQPCRPEPPTPDVPLTARQRQIVDFITEYIDVHGYPPSLREIGHGVGLKSASNVNYQLGRLVEHGLLERSAVAKRARGLKLIKGGA